MKVLIPPAQVITTADAKAHLRVEHSDEDALITAYIVAAHAVAQHYVGRPIGSQTLELALDEFPDEAIDVGAGVTSILLVSYVDTNGATQSVSASNYSLDNYDALRCWVLPAYSYDWPATRDVANAVKVQVVAGDLPSEVRSAILLMVGWLYENRGNDMAEDDIQPAAAKALLNTVRVWGF